MICITNVQIHLCLRRILPHSRGQLRSMGSNTPPNSIHINYFCYLCVLCVLCGEKVFGCGSPCCTTNRQILLFSRRIFRAVDRGCVHKYCFLNNIRVHSPDSRHSRLTCFSSVPPCLRGRCLVAAVPRCVHQRQNKLLFSDCIKSVSIRSTD